MTTSPQEPTWWAPTDVGVTFDVRVVPNARRTELVGTIGDALRIRISAPAVDDKANEHLRRFVGELFGVRRSAVRIVRGRRSRTKTLQIVGVDEPPSQVRNEVSRLGARS